MEVVGRSGEALEVSLYMLRADPRDLHVLPGYERDDRTLDKCVLEKMKQLTFYVCIPVCVVTSE